MTLPPQDYLDWAKREQGHYTYDLSSSAIGRPPDGILPRTLRRGDILGHAPLGYPALVRAIARRYGVPRSRVVTTHGVSNALYLLAATLVDPGDEVIVESPCYEPIERVFTGRGARVVRAARLWDEGFRLEPGRVARAITTRTRAIVVTDPHNPSGARIGDRDMAALARLAARARGDRRPIHLIVDEVYRDAATPGRPGSAARRHPHVIAVSSLSKSYGMGTLHVGWVLAPRALVPALRHAQSHVVGENALVTEWIAAAAFGKLDRIREDARRRLASNLDRLARWATARGDVTLLRPEGGTVALVRLPAGWSSTALLKRLSARGVLVAPGHFFDLPGCIRIGLGPRGDVFAEGLARLGQVLDTRGPRGRRNVKTKRPASA